MRTVVCIKLVPDPEAPISSFSVVEPNKVVVAEYIPRHFGPYDESAIEAALRLKDKFGGEVILMCFGPRDIREKVVEAMATGADKAVLVASDDYGLTDSYGVARALAAAIQKIEAVDLVLCGRQASDTDAGIVGPALAGLLNYSVVTISRNIELAVKGLIVEQQADEGYQTVEVTLPAVLSVTSENYILRYASLAGIMAAAEKEVRVWELPQLEFKDACPGEKYSFTRCLCAEILDSTVQCEIISGDNEDDMVKNLIAQLKKDKVL